MRLGHTVQFVQGRHHIEAQTAQRNRRKESHLCVTEKCIPIPVFTVHLDYVSNIQLYSIVTFHHFLSVVSLMVFCPRNMDFGLQSPPQLLKTFLP